MSRLRVAFITRRFWPLAGSQSTQTRLLAEGLHQSGDTVGIITSYPNPRWPEHFVFRGIPVQRVGPSLDARWQAWRAARIWRRFFLSQSDKWDVVCFVEPCAEFGVALQTADACRHLIVCAEKLRTHYDPLHGFDHQGKQWLRLLLRGHNAPDKSRPNCPQVTYLVLDSAFAVHLSHHGISEAQIHVLPPGVPLPEPSSKDRKHEARAILASSIRDVPLKPNARVGLYAGSISASRNLANLVAAWRQIVDIYPDTDLWIVGDGDYRSQLYERIGDAGLARRVFLLGTFDDLSDVYDAADFFVLPERPQVFRWTLLESLAQGLPVVAVDSPECRRLLPAPLHAFLAPEPTAGALAASVGALLRHDWPRAQWGSICRNYVAANFPMSRMLESFRALCVTKAPTAGELFRPNALLQPS